MGGEHLVFFRYPMLLGTLPKVAFFHEKAEVVVFKAVILGHIMRPSCADLGYDYNPRRSLSKIGNGLIGFTTSAARRHGVGNGYLT